MVVSIVAAYARSRPPGLSTDGTGDMASSLLLEASEVADALVSAVGETLGMSTPKAASSVPVVDAPVAAPKRSTPPAPAPVAPEEAAPIAVAAEPVTEPPADRSHALAEMVETQELVKVEDLTLYSAADTAIVPPTPPRGSPLRPWLANSPEPGLVVEVTVAHDGTAEKVRMLSARRFSDAAILSQVKAWRFTPALRDGQPVRYRVVLHDPAEAQ
jgi:outer membrane biosynthesis protein TonB